MDDFEKKVDLLYDVKLSKYSTEDMFPELADMLYEEAVKEVLCSTRLNGGRKVRR